MISVKCPHCHVGLKVDEGKIPLDLSFFNCPKCKQPIPVSLIRNIQASNHYSDEGVTEVLHTNKTLNGRLLVISDDLTPKQELPLYEGTWIIGRKSQSSSSNLQIDTQDKSMSREHIRIEVKKDVSGGYKCCLSDNNSKNHTLYNNSFLKEGEVIVLNDNDEIVIGHTTLRFIGK